MTRMSRASVLLSVLVTVAAIASPTTASAAEVERLVYQNGGSACTGALPTYEGALRKRPLAIVNEGTANAFVTCSLPVEEKNASFPMLGYLKVQNTSGVAVTIECSLVAGAQWEGSVVQPKSIPMSGNGALLVSWTPAEGATYLPRRTVNFSCLLPPGTGIAYAGKRYMEDVGN